MNGRKSSETTHDYHLLLEEDLRDDTSDEISQPSSSSISSLRSLRLPWYVFRIPFRNAIRIVLGFPFFAFCFAIIFAMMVDYDRAVNVLCTKENNRKIRNYLPSLSAAIGDFTVSQTVWTLSIVIHAPPRFLFGSMYLKYFESILPPHLYKWAYFAWILSVLEISGLVGLSIITSRQNLAFHATCFGTFLVASELYMLFQCFLQSKRKKSQGASSMEQKSLLIKKFLMKLIIVCTVVLVYTYFRHEAYCETGVYTVFAVVEYVIILANMGFHGCSYWDFYDRVIVIDLCRPFVSPSSNSLSWTF